MKIQNKIEEYFTEQDGLNSNNSFEMKAFENFFLPAKTQLTYCKFQYFL